MGSVPYYTLDTGDIPSKAPFNMTLLQDHPEVDCLIVDNASVQRRLQVSNFDLTEIDINIRGLMHLTINLLPHLKSNLSGALIVNITSVLGYIPFSIINPVYKGTKAWLHLWSMNLRTQLKDTEVRVVEIAPPTVSTALHREREDLNDKKKENNGAVLGVEEFMEEVGRGWEGSGEIVVAGVSRGIVDWWYEEFGPPYEKAAGTK